MLYPPATARLLRRSALPAQSRLNAALGWPTISRCSTPPKATASIAGVIGDLEPGTPEFRKHLDLFAQNPLFRGIRYGNLWGRNLAQKISDPSFIADLKILPETNLVLETANPNPALINAVVRLSDQVSNLTIVLDHLPAMQMPEDPVALKACQSDLALLGSRPRVVAKSSGFVKPVNGRIPDELSSYPRARIRVEYV